MTMNETHDSDNKTKLVVLNSGERLEFRGEDARGIHTDAGIHDWSEVLGFRIWNQASQMWMSVPV